MSNKVIIVENDLALNKLICIQLIRSGFEIISLSDGKDAIEAGLKNPEMLMLLNYTLDDLSCETVIKAIQSKNPSFYFVIMTALGNERIAVDLMRMGALNYISKNLEFIELLPSFLLKTLDEIKFKNEYLNLSDKFRLVENNYKTILENTADLIVQINLDGIIIFCNKKSEDILGYHASELIGINRKQIIHQEYHDYVDESLKNKMAGHTKPDFIKMIKKNGEIIDVSINSGIIKDDKGMVNSVVCMIADITERKFEQELLIKHSYILRNLSKTNDLYDVVRFISESIKGIEGITSICFILSESKTIIYNYNYSPEITTVFIEILNNIIDNQTDHFKAITYADEPVFKKYLKGVQDNSPDHFLFREIKRNNNILGTFIFSFENIQQYTNKAEREINTLMLFTEDAFFRILANIDSLQNQKRIDSLSRIFEQNFNDEQHLLEFALSEAISITSSKIGYIYYYDEKEQVFRNIAWSKNAKNECRIIEKKAVYQLDKTGLWGEAVRQRKAIITNNYSEPNPYKKGIPEGHVKICRHVNVPVFSNNQIVAVIGVGNKGVAYNLQDVRQLRLLMDAVWATAIKIRNEIAIQYELNKTQIINSLTQGFLSQFSEDGVYELVMAELVKLVPDATIIINQVDNKCEKAITRKFHLLTGPVGKLIKLLGFNPVGRSYSISSEMLSPILNGKLFQYKDGLYNLTMQNVPEIICKSIENIYNIKRIYLIGFSDNGQLLASIVFIKNTDTDLPNQDIIEAICRISSVAILKIRNEQKLRFSDTNLQNFIEQTSESIFLINPDGEILYANSNSAELFEINIGDILGKYIWNIQDILCKSEKYKNPLAIKRYYKMFLGNPEGNFKSKINQLKITTKNEHVKYLQFSFFHFKRHEGYLLVCVISNLTDKMNVISTKIESFKRIKKYSEAQGAINQVVSMALRESSLVSFLDSLFNILFGISWLKIESKGCYFQVDNKENALEMIFHRNLPETMKCITGKVHEGECLCGKVLLSGQKIYKTCIDSDHDFRYSKMKEHGHLIVPVKISGKVHGVLNFYLSHNTILKQEEIDFFDAIADIIANFIIRKNDEEKIVILSGKLKGMVNDLNELLNISTHELRSPLVNIAGFFKETEKLFISGHPEQQSKLHQYSEIINSNILKMELILKSMKDFYRLSSYTPEITQIHAHEIITGCIMQYEELIQRENISIIFKQKFPDCNADEQLFMSAVCHIIDNAIKYRSKQRQCVLSFDLLEDENNISFIFEDNGIGMNKEAINQAMNLFYRNEVTIIGLGLGLPYVKKIAELHNGALIIESVPDVGSKVILKIAKNIL